MMTWTKVAMSGLVAGLVVLVLSTNSLFAQTPPATPSTPSAPMAGAPLTHEQMHQMMDAMHGAGASQRMHETMGPDGEQLMEQCVAMMGMMGMMHDMGGMMRSGAMPGMMGMMHMMHGMGGMMRSGAMPGMMGETGDRLMPGMPGMMHPTH